MKIGIVLYPTFGGSGVIATELGKGLARKGHEVHFISYKRPVRLNVFMENVVLHEVTPMKYPLFEYMPYESALASKLVDIVENERLDILHVHYAIPHAAVAFMTKEILKSRGYHLPIVTTLHGTDITLVGNDPSFQPVVEFSINNSDGVTAVSHFLKEETQKLFKIDTDIEVIHNFVDLERFKPVDKDHFKRVVSPNGEKVISHVSNFRKVKRVGDVLKAFHEIQKHVPAKLLMIGDGPERNKLEGMCREWGICGSIRFLGKQDAVEELLAITDLFILPSQSESFGLAALEAMACGVPVISTNVGGLPEVVQDGYNGFLNKLGDVEGMAQNALKLLTDDSLLQTYRANAIETANKFSFDLILPKYEQYYEHILAAQQQVVS